MFLNEFLETHKGQTVYIGSGSAYVYMDVVSDKTEETLAKISDYYKSEVAKIWAQNQKRYEQMDAYIESANDRYKRLPGLLEEHREKLRIAEKSLNVMKRSGKENLIEEAQAKYDAIDEIITRLTNERKRMPRRIETLKHEKKVLPARLAKLEQRCRDYKPFINRTIKKHYVSFITGAQICIVEGYETGRYWFEQEYHNPELLKGYEEDEL